MPPDALFDELSQRLSSRTEARWVLEELRGLDDEQRTARARAMAARRKAGEPLQYVVGHWGFRTLDLLVDARALIPRPETEAIVGLALGRLATSRAKRPVVCDLGCGTGAIGLSVAVEASAAGLDVEVHLSDVSQDALSLAAENVAHTGAGDVALHLGSWFDALDPSLRGRVDVVCANPPYVSASDRAGLARELDFEPDIALVAADGEDGAAGFAELGAILEAAGPWLAPGGTLLVEHGDRQGAHAVRVARDAGYVDVVDHADLAGLPRILEARTPS